VRVKELNELRDSPSISFIDHRVPRSFMTWRAVLIDNTLEFGGTVAERHFYEQTAKPVIIENCSAPLSQNGNLAFNPSAKLVLQGHVEQANRCPAYMTFPG
jgi:hypothetical protein